MKINWKCIYISGENRFDVIWLHNYKEIKKAGGISYRSEGDDYILDIAEVFPEDAGIYTCEAFNNAGEAFTTCTILVTDQNNEPKGPLIETFPRSLTTAIGSKATFNVETSQAIDSGKLMDEEKEKLLIPSRTPSMTLIYYETNPFVLSNLFLSSSSP